VYKSSWLTRSFRLPPKARDGDLCSHSVFLRANTKTIA
jgi:hypothetical protein